MKNRRLVEIDALRGLAILGMMAQHTLWLYGWLWYLGELPAVLFVLAIGLASGVRHSVRHASESDPGRGLEGIGRPVYRVAMLMILSGILIGLDGPIAVVLGVLAVTALVLEPLILLNDRIVPVIVVPVILIALGFRFLPAFTSAIGWYAQEWPGWLQKAVGGLNDGPYPQVTWIAYGMSAYLLGRHWVRLRQSVVDCCSVFVAMTAMLAVGVVVGRRAASLSASAFLLPHSMWEGNQYADSSIGLAPEYAYRLVPYSGSPAMFAVSISIGILLLAVLRGVSAVPLVSSVLLPLGALGRVSLTAYVIHVAWISRCMSEDLSWGCGHYEGLPFLFFQLLLLSIITVVWRVARLPSSGPMELLVRAPWAVRGQSSGNGSAADEAELMADESGRTQVGPPSPGSLRHGT